MWVVYLGVPVAGAVALALWFGVFKKVEITPKRFEGGQFFYLDFQGHISTVGSKFQSVCAIRQALFGNNPKAALPTGVYYDNPNALKDPNLSRACVGLLVSESAITGDVEKKFGEQGFKKLVLPPIASLYWSFPARMGISCMIGALKFYPVVSKYVDERPDLQPVEPAEGGSVEVVEGGLIHYYYVTQLSKEYLVSPFPAPELKNKSQNKKLQ